MHTLEIKNLHVSIPEKKIINGLDLTIRSGEFHALMGPNGSGKSTLASVLLGHPGYSVEKGDIILDGESILDLPPDKRAHAGLFLAFQYPKSIPGVTLESFVRSSYSALHKAKDDNFKITPAKFKKILKKKAEILDLDPVFFDRYLNEGFSGGEKKKAEILQLLIAEPLFAVLDETDSGLDIDALKTVAKGVNALRPTNIGTLIITHYQRILHHISPDFVHVMKDGAIVESGTQDLAKKLEDEGYAWLKN